MNVIVICSDTFRYDHLGFLNRQSVQTPNLDRLAGESAAFTDFWLCSFPTLVNRIELFTGRFAFPFFNWGPLPYQFPVLAEVFQRHGCVTALFADTLHMIRKGWGYGRGFDFVDAVHGQMHDRFQPKSTPMVELPCPVEKIGVSRDRLERYRRNAYWYRQQGTNTTATLFRAAMEWLEQPRERFFIWIDAFDPHEPWDAPAEFLKPYPWNEEGGAVFWPKVGYANKYSQAEIENMRSLYRAEVTQIDHWIGELLSHLRDRRLLDNTAVLFCSDHGFYFGEHRLLGKPTLRKIPQPTALLRGTGSSAAADSSPRGAGQGPNHSRTLPAARPVSHRARTRRPPACAVGARKLARAPAARRTQSATPRRRGSYPIKKGLVGCLAVWTEEWCLMYTPLRGLEGSELFHLPTDPTQQHNVIVEQPQVARQLYDQLIGWLDRLGVSARRKQQLLFNEGFPHFRKLQYGLTLWNKRLSYWKHYRQYAHGG